MTRQNSESKKVSASTPPTYLQYGIAMKRSTLRALEKRGIYCQTSVSLEHQHLAGRYVLRGIESGGAVSDMGRYCAYVGSDGQSLSWLQSIDSISGNGRHAVVLAPSFIRIEMFRIRRTYELAITRHELQPQEGRQRPTIATTLLFRGQEGTLPLDLWAQEHRAVRGACNPSFYSDAGELREIPLNLEGIVRKVTSALNCLSCKHVHVAVAPTPCR